MKSNLDPFSLKERVLDYNISFEKIFIHITEIEKESLQLNEEITILEDLNDFKKSLYEYLKLLKQDE